MRSLRDAALRGVRVRLLVDDLYTVGGDPMFSGLAAFPNVEVRFFNPFCCARQSIAGKYVASLADFGRLNHRMHNKLFIADGAIAVAGGRNNRRRVLHAQRHRQFRRHGRARRGCGRAGPRRHLRRLLEQPAGLPPWERYSASPTTASGRNKSFDSLVDDGEQMMVLPLPPIDILGYGPIRDDLDAGRLGLVWGTAIAFADKPAKVTATSDEMARSMSVQMNVMDKVMASRSEVYISSPYFIPGPMGMQAFGDLRKRNVKVTILTNSLAANDEPLVHTGYARYRVELLSTRRRPLRAQPDAYPAQTSASCCPAPRSAACTPRPR